ncbi:MAG TPA: helix-turn-helix domain-containing protein [Allosphingosinicella sp.]|nr:helix-turn-helix domain-containing protein [Allosphingosinicella sp.]
MSEGPTDSFLVETPAQLKALSDPFRQRLLEQFAKAATIKQAAARLGLPPTRLYHHVDLLLAAGLIRVTGEARRRAVIERSFETVARRFAVSPAAFGGESGRAGERGRIARSNVEELLAGAEDSDGAFRLLRTRLPLSQAGREKLEAGLQRLLDELKEPGAPYVDLLMLSARQG